MIKYVVHIIKKHKVKSILVALSLIAYYFCLPENLFEDPTATVIESVDNELLGATIAEDGQWRFPELDSIPEKFKTSILLFEDEYFYKHPGFNPVSIVKAVKQNLKSGGIRRGGSTLTQQVIRLSRKGKSRTYFEKFKELILATRLEFRMSKNEILQLYASHAPFGGNVIGIDAASWRYFNRSASELSWAESATLAVLPNAPSLIYPGKSQTQLKKKRDRLLLKLHKKGYIDTLTYKLSLEEELPKRPYTLPQIAPHLLHTIRKEKEGKRIKTTIDKALQEQCNDLVSNHYNILKQNQIHNAAVLVMHVPSRKVLAYVGNSPTTNEHQKSVDIITKSRSTGSLLKPLLYAAMLDSGSLLPEMLIPDVPTHYGNYHPENFDKEFEGAVHASKALSRSLNVPAVRMLQSFGLDRFHHYIGQLNMKGINKSVDHYGLSVILGGAESSLWDLCKSYANLSSTLRHFTENSSQYFSNEFMEPTYFADETIDFGKFKFEKNVYSAASIYFTYVSLKKVNRPNEDEHWEFFDESKEIAWKTGTSFGFRDAWAIGTTKDYVVGVWVGNADGEGRPGLVGVATAAPLMFDVFDLLPNSTWFSTPYDEMREVSICPESGHRTTNACIYGVTKFIPVQGLETTPCSFHKIVQLNKTKTHRVNTSCVTQEDLVPTSWFALPPVMAYYYKKNNPFYQSLPPFMEGCDNSSTVPMQFIYPEVGSTFFLPTNFDGNDNQLIVKIAHEFPEKEVFWYLNEEYVGSTSEFHELAVIPKTGKHLITAVDEDGNELKRYITITK